MKKTLLAVAICALHTPYAFAIDGEGKIKLDHADYPSLVEMNCTGAIIGNRFVLTAEHCKDNAHSVNFVLTNTQLNVIETYVDDFAGDIALWEIENTESIDKVLFLDPNFIENTYIRPDFADSYGTNSTSSYDTIWRNRNYQGDGSSDWTFTHLGFGSTHGQLHSAAYWLNPYVCYLDEGADTCSVNQDGEFYYYGDSGSLGVSGLGLPTDTYLTLATEITAGSESWDAPYGAVIAGDSGGAVLFRGKIVATLVGLNQRIDYRDHLHIQAALSTSNSTRIGDSFVKPFILRTINGWHYPNVAEVSAGQQRTIEIQSLHEHSEVADFSTEGDLDIVVSESSCLDGLIEPFAICTVTVSSANGDEGRLILNSPGEANGVIEVNKAEPVEPDNTGGSGNANDNGDSGGSSGIVYLLLGALAVAARAIKLKPSRQ